MKILKHLSITLMAISIISFISCQKEQKQNLMTSNSGVGVTKHTYNYVDTTTHNLSQSSSNKSSGKVTNGLFDVVPVPYIQLNYKGTTFPSGLGNYSIVAYNNSHGDNIICTYSLFTSSGLALNFGANTGHTVNGGSAQGYGFSMTPAIGSYYVSIYYSQGIIQGNTVNAPFTIYDKPLPPAGLLAFYRYIHNVNQNHYYNSDWAELASGGNGYHFETVQGYLYSNSAQATNLAPLYRFYSATNGDHVYTNGTAELGGNKNFVNEGITGYISTVAAGNFTTPLNRYFNGKFHFFCSPPEDPTSSGYHFEGLVGYIQKPQ